MHVNRMFRSVSRCGRIAVVLALSVLPLAGCWVRVSPGMRGQPPRREGGHDHDRGHEHHDQGRDHDHDHH